MTDDNDKKEQLAEEIVAELLAARWERGAIEQTKFKELALSKLSDDEIAERIMELRRPD